MRNVPPSIRTMSENDSSVRGWAEGSMTSSVIPSSLRRQAWKRLHLRDRRRVPFADEHLGFRSVHAHQQVERRLGGRQPVGLLVLSGALVLKIEIERAV